MIDIVFRDVILLALAGFIAIIILILPWINPPKKEDQEKPKEDMIVEIFWNDKEDTDLDLWTKAPNDVPVGYANTGGVMFNLLRDDLGYYNDISKRNQEIAISRGIIPGIYTINVMFYADRWKASDSAVSRTKYPVEALVIIRLKIGKELTHILDKTIQFTKVGQEITVANITLNEELVVTNIDNIYRRLASSQ